LINSHGLIGSNRCERCARDIVKPADTHTSRDVAALLGEKRNAPEADIAVAGCIEGRT
jgi:hypothetical protein